MSLLVCGVDLLSSSSPSPVCGCAVGVRYSVRSALLMMTWWRMDDVRGDDRQSSFFHIRRMSTHSIGRIILCRSHNSNRSWNWNSSVYCALYHRLDSTRQQKRANLKRKQVVPASKNHDVLVGVVTATVLLVLLMAADRQHSAVLIIVGQSRQERDQHPPHDHLFGCSSVNHNCAVQASI
mmetsp:Transcript_16633/g.18972  ORF Transcript_16633/g.18972 Transcript_16633/m.18972 type:complete len:180 (-) Transcript_16633:299-838(-)